MSVVITNVSPHDGADAVSQYIVRVNTGPTIAEFAHWRGDGLARCLRLAADAVEAAGKPNPHADKSRSPTPSPDATVPGAIPAEVRKLAEGLLTAIGSVNWCIGHAQAVGDDSVERKLTKASDQMSLAFSYLAATSRAAPTDQPEAPGCFECSGPLNGPYCPACRPIPNEERIRREAAEERIREDERDRLLARAQTDMLVGTGSLATQASDAFSWLL